jgi:hypothetical protein
MEARRNASANHTIQHNGARPALWKYILKLECGMTDKVTAYVFRHIKSSATHRQGCDGSKQDSNDDEAALTADIIAFSTEYGHYGYRRIAAMLRDAGWVVNVKRIERIWRLEGLKVPQKQPKRGRLWLNDGSCNPIAAGTAEPCLVLRLRRGSRP